MNPRVVPLSPPQAKTVIGNAVFTVSRCGAVFGRVFENRYSSGVEYYVKFWSTTRVFGQYSGVVAGVLVVEKKSIFRTNSENFQNVFQKYKEKRFKNKDSGVSLFVKAQ